MAIGPTAGTKLYIAPPATSLTFSPDLFIEIGEIANLGEIGRTYTEITSEAVGSREVRKFKGTYNDGTMQVVVNFDADDAGQEDVLDAVASDEDYWFKIIANDDTGGNTVPTTITFQAKVMSSPFVFGGPNQVVQRNIALAIKSGSTTITEAT